MRRRSDSRRGIRYEPFCLLLERHPVESKPSRRERSWSCGRQRARRTLMIRYPARTAQFPGEQLQHPREQDELGTLGRDMSAGGGGGVVAGERG